MASKLLVPILLGAICMLTVVTAGENSNFKDSQVISMPKEKSEKDLVLFIQWGYSYCCPKNTKTCCLSPYLSPDFILQSIRTLNGEGQYETNCNGPLFDKNKLSQEDLEYIELYWPSLNCTYSNVQYWKQMWETFGRCAGLSQEEYFNLAIKLFEPDFTVYLNALGIVPGGKYKEQQYKKALGRSVGGHNVGLRCTPNSVTGERQLYDAQICYSQEKKEVIDCDSAKLPSPGDYFDCSGAITLPRKPCNPSKHASSCYSDDE